MKEISIWRKIKLYFLYRRNLIKNKEFLLQKGIRIDRVKRIYTVINLPEEFFDGVYDLKTSDINRISRSYLSESLKDLREILDGLELNELYKIYENKKVDKYSFLIVIGYKFFNTRKIANNFFYIVLPILSIAIITSLLITFLN